MDTSKRQERAQESGSLSQSHFICFAGSSVGMRLLQYLSECGSYSPNARCAKEIFSCSAHQDSLFGKQGQHAKRPEEKNHVEEERKKKNGILWMSS